MKNCLPDLRVGPVSMGSGRFDSQMMGAAVVLSLIGWTLVGCAPTETLVETPPAKELTDRPVAAPLADGPAVTINSLMAEQSDESVTISGTVAKRVPVLEGWLYQMSDNTGSLWVLTERSDPTVGELATVQGLVRYEAITVGEVDASEMYLEEQSYRRGDG
jgi:hypothetical protein